MGKGKKKSDNPFEVRERQYCGELYADNPLHMAALAHLKRNPDFRENFVGIWHIQYDENGKEIIHEKGKKHCHFILDFENARYWSAICKKLGLVDSSGMPEVRFVYPIGYHRDYQSFERGLVYLTHANKPSAEQYPLSALFGSPRLIDLATRATVAYQQKNVRQADALKAIRNWIVSHFGEVISPTMFIDWVTNTPYCRASSSPWVYRMIEDHNFIVNRSKSQYLAEQEEKWKNWMGEKGYIVNDG